MIGNVNIGGALRPVKYGTAATALVCEKLGMTIAGFDKVFDAHKLKSKEVSAHHFMVLIWACLVSGARSSHLPVDFDEYTVGDWIDDMDIEGMKQIFEVIAYQGSAVKKKIEVQAAPLPPSSPPLGNDSLGEPLKQESAPPSSGS